jgi:hypothetical protein
MKQNNKVNNSMAEGKIDIRKEEEKLTQLFDKVNKCVNKRITNPEELENNKNVFRSTQPKNLKGGSLKNYQLEALVWMIELAAK